MFKAKTGRRSPAPGMRALSPSLEVDILLLEGMTVLVMRVKSGYLADGSLLVFLIAKERVAGLFQVFLALLFVSIVSSRREPDGNTVSVPSAAGKV